MNERTELRGDSKHRGTYTFLCSLESPTGSPRGPTGQQSSRCLCPGHNLWSESTSRSFMTFELMVGGGRGHAGICANPTPPRGSGSFPWKQLNCDELGNQREIPLCLPWVSKHAAPLTVLGAIGYVTCAFPTRGKYPHHHSCLFGLVWFFQVRVSLCTPGELTL